MAVSKPTIATISVAEAVTASPDIGPDINAVIVRRVVIAVDIMAAMQASTVTAKKTIVERSMWRGVGVIVL